MSASSKPDRRALRSTALETARASHPAGRLPGPLATVLLVFVLPLFGQSFHYLHEFPVPYLLSKAWPILTLPLSLYAMIWLELPAKRAYLVFLAYAIGITPFTSMVQLGNGLIDAVITTVKVWPLTYYFALSGLLVLLAPGYRRTKSVVVGLGVATFVLMLALWILVPTSWYVNDPELGKLFMVETERGYRIYMPMFFGALLLFYLTRSFMQRPNLLVPLAIVIAFVLMLTIYKQRAAIGSMFLVCGYGVIVSLKPRLKLAAVGGFIAIIPIAVGYFVLRDTQNIADALGGSLSVRQNSLALASHFLGDSPWRWLFGVGATTRFGTVTLADIFGDSQFYIADLGWFGIIFEYGAVGALLLAGLYGWCLFRLLREVGSTSDPMILALSDYILYMLATSAVYSLVFTPGELGVVMALAIYLHRASRQPSVSPRPARRLQFTVNKHRVTI